MCAPLFSFFTHATNLLKYSFSGRGEIILAQGWLQNQRAGSWRAIKRLTTHPFLCSFSRLQVSLQKLLPIQYFYYKSGSYSIGQGLAHTWLQWWVVFFQFLATGHFYVYFMVIVMKVVFFVLFCYLFIVCRYHPHDHALSVHNAVYFFYWVIMLHIIILW